MPARWTKIFLAFLVISLFLFPPLAYSDSKDSKSSQKKQETSEPLKLSQPILHFPNELNQMLQSAQNIPVCGNGKREIGEGCDDGNRKSGDGCNQYCQRELSQPCTTSEQCQTEYCRISANATTGVCAESECGNGKVEGREQCDDGNKISGDGCSSACLFESVCGNGKKEGNEECDDGNKVSGDGCSATCTIELAEGKACRVHSDCATGFCAPIALRCATPVCGNGVLEGAEQCDDGNIISGDGCSATCQLEGNAKNKLGVQPCPGGSAAGGCGAGMALKDGCCYPIVNHKCPANSEDTCCVCVSCRVSGSVCECDGTQTLDATKDSQACQQGAL